MSTNHRRNIDTTRYSRLEKLHGLGKELLASGEPVNMSQWAYNCNTPSCLLGHATTIFEGLEIIQTSDLPFAAFSIMNTETGNINMQGAAEFFGISDYYANEIFGASCLASALATVEELLIGEEILLEE